MQVVVVELLVLAVCLPRSGFVQQVRQLGLPKAAPLRYAAFGSRLREAFTALTASSPLSRRYASEQGAGPDTVNRTIKLRLLARPTAPVSAAIGVQRSPDKVFKQILYFLTLVLYSIYKLEVSF